MSKNGKKYCGAHHPDGRGCGCYLEPGHDGPHNISGNPDFSGIWFDKLKDIDAYRAKILVDVREKITEAEKTARGRAITDVRDKLGTVSWLFKALEMCEAERKRLRSKPCDRCEKKRNPHYMHGVLEEDVVEIFTKDGVKHEWTWDKGTILCRACYEHATYRPMTRIPKI